MGVGVGVGDGDFSAFGGIFARYFPILSLIRDVLTKMIAEKGVCCIWKVKLEPLPEVSKSSKVGRHCSF